MPHNIKIIIYILFSLMMMPDYAGASRSHPLVKSNIKELLKLDTLIARSSELEQIKESRISELRKSLYKSKDSNERLLLTKKLFEEYRYFDSDSALMYSRKAYDIARQMSQPNDSLITMILIDQAFIHSIQGFHLKAAEILDKIQREMLNNPEIRMKYFKAKEYGVSMELVYANDNKENTDIIKKKLLQYRDSLNEVRKILPDRYIWLPIAEKVEKGNVEDIDPVSLKNLKLSIDTVSDLINADAPSAFWLSRYYEASGDSVLMIHYLIKASQIKILNQIRENPSLPELAGHLFDYGDLDRAFNYMMYSGDEIKAYKNRNRIVLTNAIISDVKDAYNAKLKERDRILHIYMVVLIVITISLVIFIFALINRNKKLHTTRDQLSKVNSELVDALNQRDSAIDSLKTANDELARLNKMKHQVIALAFQLASIQIGRLNEFRKKLLRKFKTKQYTEVEVALNNDEIIKESHADLNKTFDKTVISTFPEFIEEYNDCCEDMEKVDIETIRKTQSLNVRLRIYALRRLGIEKSADLAQMLNVSIRTVYNNRSIDPKNS